LTHFNFVNKLPLVFATFEALIGIPCNIFSENVNTFNIFGQILPVKSLHHLKQKNVNLKQNLVQHRNDTNILIVNYIMLLAKYFIFRSKCLNQIPVITVVHTYVKNKMVVEEVIATMNNQLNMYTAK